MSKLDSLREEIDKVDTELVHLLNRRANLALQVRETKKQENINVYCAKREREILEQAAAVSEGPLPAESIKRILISVLSANRALIGELKIGYLGARGSSSSEVARRQFGDEVSFVASETSAELLESLKNRSCHYGALPAEERTSVTEKGLEVVAEMQVDGQNFLVVKCASSE